MSSRIYLGELEELILLLVALLNKEAYGVPLSEEQKSRQAETSASAPFIRYCTGWKKKGL